MPIHVIVPVEGGFLPVVIVGGNAKNEWLAGAAAHMNVCVTNT